MKRIQVMIKIFSLVMICCFLCNLSIITNANSNNTDLCESFDNDPLIDTGINLAPTISSPITDISIPARVSFDNTGVQYYTIETDGLIATEVEQGSMEYDLVATEEYGILDVYATYDDGTVLQSSVYTYLNGDTVYLSEYSSKNALERYLGCAVEDNIYTLEEAEAIWNGFACQNEDINGDIINPQPEVGGFLNPDKGTICGTLTWKNDITKASEPTHPLRHVKVAIYKKVAGVYWRIATTYTNDSGYFSAEIPENDNIYVGVFAGDGNIIVKSSVIGGKYKYIFEDNPIQVYAGTTTTVNVDPIYMNTDEGQAIQISQAALVARDYAEEMMNETPNEVKIIYPADSDSCYYNSYITTIFILKKNATTLKPASYSSWDVIMHEYGHHIQNELNISDSMGEGHYIDDNMADHYKDHYVKDNFTNCNIECILYKKYINLPSLIVGENECKKTGDTLAWMEAWTTVFALMAQNYYASQLIGIDTVANTSYNAYNVTNINIENYSARKGESCELSVAEVLWDIFDSNNDGGDTISLGHEAFWDISTREGTYTFSDFMNIFYSEYPEYQYEIASNLEKYQMTIDWKSILSTGVTSITNPITLEWNAQGGSMYYPNNLFSVIVYNNGEEVFRKNGINTTSYSFALDEWQELLSDCGYKCGEKLELDIAIAAYQDDSNSHVTGPYYSALKTLTIDHSCRYETASTTHSYICNDCGYIETYPHDLQLSNITSTHHTYGCAECGYSVTSEHDMYTSPSISPTEHGRKCRDCGYVDESTVGTHSYNSFMYVSDTAHRSTCDVCGVWKETTSPHTFTILDRFGKMACIGCGYTKYFGSDSGNIILSITKVSANGSYILPDGTIMLVDEDIEAYLNGTLVFYDKGNVPQTH